MRTKCALLAVLPLIAVPGAAVAQMGGVIDIIHKMSGPPFLGLELSYFNTIPGDEEVRFRGAIAYRVSIAEEGQVVPADANITMFTIQPTLEFPVRGSLPLEFGAGLALHHFGGDADGFWNFSVPLLAQYRPRLAGSVSPRIGVGVHLFRPFGDDDFEPLVVDVSRSGVEAVFQLLLGIDYRW